MPTLDNCGSFSNTHVKGHQFLILSDQGSNQEIITLESQHPQENFFSLTSMFVKEIAESLEIFSGLQIQP